MKRMFGKRFRAGGYAMFAGCAVIILAILANMLVSALPSSATEIDLSGQGLYSLSDQTKRIASALQKDVNFYLLAVDGQEDETVLRLLNRYADLSDHIRVTCVDPTVDPTFLTPYELDVNQLYANSVLVDCGGRFRLVGYDDIFVTDYVYDQNSYYGYSTTTSFDGENALTNALHYVASDDLPVVYVLTGHGESDLGDNIWDMIEQDNMTVEDLSLLSLDEMPEDADLLLINAPETDLNEDEAALLVSWLQAGGHILLNTDMATEEKFPNLMTVTKAMGLTAGTGLVIEGNAQMRVNRYPHYLLPDIASHEITDALAEAGYYILMPFAHPIEEAEGSDAEITWLLTTSDSAYLKPAGTAAKTTEKEEGDPEGSVHVAAAAELGDGRLVWFASKDMLDEYVDRMVSSANSNLYLNAVNWMCGQQESIAIRSKSLSASGLTVTAAQNSFWTAVLVVIVPAAVLVLGMTVYFRRKRR